MQFTSLMQFDDHAVYAVEDGFTAHSGISGISGLRVIEGIGKYSERPGEELDTILPQSILNKPGN